MEILTDKGFRKCLAAGRFIGMFDGLQKNIHDDAMNHGLFEGKNGVHDYCEWLQKECTEVRLADPQHRAEEMSDVVILTMSYAEHLGIDLGAALIDKMEYNKTRPYRHKEGKITDEH